MKNLLKMGDLSPAELTHILDVADQLKADCKAGRTAPLLAGKAWRCCSPRRPPAPAPALRWVCTRWAVWATT